MTQPQTVPGGSADATPATGADGSSPPVGTGATSLSDRTARLSDRTTRLSDRTTQLSDRAARLTDRIPETPPRVREFFGRRPTVGPGPAAQAVATDISDLVKAELALAKSEFTQKATGKGLGAGLFIAAAVAGWLGLQGLLIFFGFLLAIWLPAWAAALIVTAVLFIVAGILAFVGKNKFATPLGLDTAKTSVQTDIEYAKAHVNGPNPA